MTHEFRAQNSLQDGARNRIRPDIVVHQLRYQRRCLIHWNHLSTSVSPRIELELTVSGFLTEIEVMIRFFCNPLGLRSKDIM